MWLAAVVAVFACGLQAQAKASDLIQVPFVGCAADGMAGAAVAKQDDGTSLLLASVLGVQLAYYSAGPDFAVLAPRGWHCIVAYGSDGAILFVTPQKYDPFAMQKEMVLTGPAIQLTLVDGSTSGRFVVARVAARLFPLKRAIVASVVAENVEPATNFPSGPFPRDILTRRSRTDVAYITPGGAEGEGTVSRLAKGADPIYGEALFTADGRDLLKVDVRLPPRLSALASTIVTQARALAKFAHQ